MAASDVFGTWADWGDSWAADRAKLFVGEIPPHVRETWSESVVTAREVVNLENLRRYAIQGQGRRQELLTNSIKLPGKTAN